MATYISSSCLEQVSFGAADGFGFLRLHRQLVRLSGRQAKRYESRETSEQCPWQIIRAGDMKIP